MKSIAVVEDEKEAADALTVFLERYGREKNEEFGVFRFENADAFLAGYDSRFDVVFMDIELPGTDGMTAAGKLRALDSEVMIIFVTNMAQYAIKGYEVRAFDFIVKPVTYGNFFVKMTSALECLRLKAGKDVWIANKDGKRRLRTSAIRYVEVVQHMLIYHTVDGDFRASGSLANVGAELRGEPFAMCNRCYFVNLKYVTAVKSADVCLGAEKLQISRLKRASFMSALNDYLAGGV